MSSPGADWKLKHVLADKGFIAGWCGESMDFHHERCNGRWAGALCRCECHVVDDEE